MNPSRLLLVVLGCLVFCPTLVSAQDLDFANPFGPTQQFSADMVITTKDGTTMTQKMYCDSGKVRTEINVHGMEMVSIERPDLEKAYQIMVAQKVATVMPYDPGSVKPSADAGPGPHGKFVVVGPDTADGVACTKYQGTAAKANKVMFYWVNAETKAPVKMMAEDGSLTMVWKNYKAGPQAAALFVPPPDYKVMSMPAGAPGMGQ